MLPKTTSPPCNFPTQPSSFKWRSQIQQSQLISQISTLLLQRKHWIPILRNSHLFSKLTPDLLLFILQNTQNHPHISLDFFNWSKTHLPFKPDLKSHIKIIQILLQSNLQEPAKRLLKDIRSLAEPTSVSTVLNASTRVCKRNASRSLILSFLLENYSKHGSINDALEVFRKIQFCRCVPSVCGCNALLDALQRSDETRLLWCFYSAATRSGVVPNSATWVLLTRVFCKEGKLGMAVKMLNSGIWSVGMCNLMVDYYGRNGLFSAAMELLNQMHYKKFKLGFGTYSSILDGACKFNDIGIVDLIMTDMVTKELLPAMPLLDFDSIIWKLCKLGKPHAANMFFERALNEKIELGGASYVCMLKMLSKEGRLGEAMKVYGFITEKSIEVNADCYGAFVNLICNEEPTKEANLVVKDVIEKGFLPDVLHLSKYLDAQCCNGRWDEAKDLLNLVLEKGLLPDGICCRSLVEHYCSHAGFDAAIALHNKVERLGGSLDITTYNVLLGRLCEEEYIEEAINVFSCMRKRNVLSSESYSIMIMALFREKQMRKAMKFHDEMLEKRLKPDDETYKRLISGFV